MVFTNVKIIVYLHRCLAALSARARASAALAAALAAAPVALAALASALAHAGVRCGPALAAFCTNAALALAPAGAAGAAGAVGAVASLGAAALETAPSSSKRPREPGGSGRKPCCFFAHGLCRNGAHCAFAHDALPAALELLAPDAPGAVTGAEEVSLTASLV